MLTSLGDTAASRSGGAPAGPGGVGRGVVLISALQPFQGIIYFAGCAAERRRAAGLRRRGAHTRSPRVPALRSEALADRP